MTHTQERSFTYEILQIKYGVKSLQIDYCHQGDSAIYKSIVSDPSLSIPAASFANL